MTARNPDFATLSEAAYEAADRLLDLIGDCDQAFSLGKYKALREDYRTKKDKALKALRRKK